MRSIRSKLVVLLASGALSSASTWQTSASAETPARESAGKTLKEHLETQFDAPLASCLDDANLKRFRAAIKKTDAKSAIPKEVRTALFEPGSRGEVAVTELSGVKMSLLFASLWEKTSEGASSTMLYGRKPSGQPLQVTASSGDDRRIYADKDSVLFTHNCSTIIGAALEAKAPLKPPMVEAALKGSYNRRDSTGLSLMQGTFSSPFADLISPPSTGQAPSHAALLETNLALWDWYGRDASRAKGSYEFLGSLEGVSLYVTKGATWSTNTSGEAGFKFIVGGASTNGALKVDGTVEVTRFVVLANNNVGVKPDFRPLPTLGTVVSRVGQYASSIPREDSSRSLSVADGKPFDISYKLPFLNSSLCTAERVKRAADGPAITVRWQEREPASGSFCQVTRTFTPSTTVPNNGQHAVDFKVLLTQESLGQAGDIVLHIDRGITISDERGAFTVQPIASEGVPFVFKDERPTGTLMYRVSKRSGTLSLAGASWNFKSSCADEETPRDIAIGQPQLTPNGPRESEVRFSVPRLESSRNRFLQENGGECLISGTVEIPGDGNSGTPVVLTLPAQRVAVTKDPALAGTGEGIVKPRIALPQATD